MKKQEKTFLVDNLTEELKRAKSVILVDYSGLNMALQEDLKKKLKKQGANMKVVKNTLLKIAGKNAKLDEKFTDDEVLVGQTAVIIAGEDPITPLKVLADFAKENELPELKVGIVEGSFQEKSSLETLSKLPGKDALLVQVLGGVAAPMYGIVGTLGANLQKLVSILDQASKKGGEK